MTVEQTPAVQQTGEQTHTMEQAMVAGQESIQAKVAGQEPIQALVAVEKEMVLTEEQTKLAVVREIVPDLGPSADQPVPTVMETPMQTPVAVVQQTVNTLVPATPAVVRESIPAVGLAVDQITGAVMDRLQISRGERMTRIVCANEKELREAMEKLETDERGRLKKKQRDEKKPGGSTPLKGVHKGPLGGGKSREKEKEPLILNHFNCFDVLRQKREKNEMTGAQQSATLVTGDRGRRPRLSSRFSGGTLPHSVYRGQCGVVSRPNSDGGSTVGEGLSKVKEKDKVLHSDDVDVKVFVLETPRFRQGREECSREF